MVVTNVAVVRPRSADELASSLREAAAAGKLASAGGRVVKNVSGYDLMKLHVGAHGSLGVIVAASFKVFPRPLRDVTVESHDGWPAADQALSLPMAPAALELFSDGRVIARYFGSQDAVAATVKATGWAQADESVWREHSLAGHRHRALVVRRCCRGGKDAQARRGRGRLARADGRT